jgi:hypothetical protein
MLLAEAMTIIIKNNYGDHISYINNIKVLILKLVVCILLRVLRQVQGFHLTQHWFKYFIQ